MGQVELPSGHAGLGRPDRGSAFGISLLRQTFCQEPPELENAAQIEGAGVLARLWRIRVPWVRPTYVAYGLVSVGCYWNYFLWPWMITNSVVTRLLTVDFAVLASTGQSVDWPTISVATLITAAPLLLALPIFQRQFVNCFIWAGAR